MAFRYFNRFGMPVRQLNVGVPISMILPLNFVAMAMSLERLQMNVWLISSHIDKAKQT